MIYKHALTHGGYAELRRDQLATEEQASLAVAGSKLYSHVRLFASGVPIGSAVLMADSPGDIQRMYELLGMLPRALEQERWRPA